jgi:hypothetical protein
MANEPNEYDIGAGDELQRRYGWYVENWVPPAIDPANVPESLRHLIPVARRWGITCDVTRHDAGRKASKSELTELRHQLQGTHALYEDWAFGALDSLNGESTECWVFGAMYRFETEECKGPGFGSKLDWAIRRFQISPDEANRERLQSALDSVIARGRRFIKPRQSSVRPCPGSASAT